MRGGITNTRNLDYLRKSSLGLDEQRVEKIWMQTTGKKRNVWMCST